GWVVTGFDDGRIEIHRASDGAFVAAASLPALLMPDVTNPPFNGARYQITPTYFAADDAGHLFVLADSWAIVGNTVTSTGSFLVALDDGSGQMLWRRRGEQDWSLLVDS